METVREKKKNQSHRLNGKLLLTYEVYYRKRYNVPTVVIRTADWKDSHDNLEAYKGDNWPSYQKKEPIKIPTLCTRG